MNILVVKDLQNITSPLYDSFDNDYDRVITQNCELQLRRHRNRRR